MRFASEAWGVVGPIFGAALAAAIWGLASHSVSGITLALILMALSGLTLAFFRDPARRPPGDERLVVSPADGRVLVAETLPDGRKRVGIFLSLLDVHVNRAPVSGTVTRVTRTAGTYFHAGSLRGESGNARVEVEAGTPFGVVSWRQLSGMLARKISCRLAAGEAVQRGDRFGLIYFGSRMDVWLPASAQLQVEVGRRVQGGESVIANFPTQENRS
jgi:phosphatidylserine decarboxylase